MLGIVAVVFSFIAFMGVVAFALGPMGVFFGIIGAIRKFARKGAAVAGFVLGILSSVTAAIWMTVLAADASSANLALNSVQKVEFKVLQMARLPPATAAAGDWRPTRRSNRHIRPATAAERVRAGSPVGLLPLLLRGEAGGCG